MRALLPLLLAVAIGAPSLAQEPEPAPSPAPPRPPGREPREPRGLTGRWVGSAKYQTDAGTACRYEGTVDPPALALDLRADGGQVRLELPTPAGTQCPPLRIESALTELSLTPSTASFSDAQGRQWNLALQMGVLRGLVTGSGGSGEVSLTRRRPERAAKHAQAASEAPASDAAEETGSTATESSGPAAGATPAGGEGKPAGPGLKAGTLGIIGANVVGLGALLAASGALQDESAGTSQLVCSPRQCLIGGPGEPCDCTATITTGAACGQTTSGVPVRGACALPDLPCQALLSCNNGVCEDRLGSCPF